MKWKAYYSCEHNHTHFKEEHLCDGCCSRDDYPGHEVDWTKAPGPREYKTGLYEGLAGLPDQVVVPGEYVLLVLPDRLVGVLPNAMTMSTVDMVRSEKGFVYRTAKLLWGDISAKPTSSKDEEIEGTKSGINSEKKETFGSGF